MSDARAQSSQTLEVTTSLSWSVGGAADDRDGGVKTDARAERTQKLDVTSKSGQAQSVGLTPQALITELAEIPGVFCLGIDQQTGHYYRRPATGNCFAWSTRNQLIHCGGGKDPRAGVNPDKLEEAGWGVLSADKKALEALAPLLELRKRQAGDRYAEFTFKPEQSAQAFLNEHNAPPGVPDPERAPYYLTVVGDAEAIPFDFQQELDVRYAVGRISLDSPDDYERYAAAVVAAEKREALRSRTAVYFGVEHENDPVTKLCAERLVKPLAGTAVLQQPGWRPQVQVGRASTHQELTDVLQSANRPAMLLTAGHGLVLSKDDPQQHALQGALVTADWSGPQGDSVTVDQLFTASDLTARADLAGMIVVLVGCFTAGTPRYDAFAEGEQVELANAPFVAAFPKRLLARGALAALGHVDSLYIHSYAWPGAGNLPQHHTFEAMLHHLMAGRRLGHAMDTFGRRYGELAARLLAARLDPGQISVDEYASYWIGYHDARQYVVLGDPAVRLAV